MTMTETAAFIIEGEDRPGAWVVTCDHASNAVPEFVAGGSLGLPETEMARHIAYDIGAAGLARALGAALDSPVVLSQFSRLVIDPNRGEDDPTLIMKLYDGTIIPANRTCGPDACADRLNRLYRPYHAAISALIAARPAPAICAVHSFTPQLRGRPPRPWEVGVLYAQDARLARPFLAKCRAAGWCVGDNAPYKGHLPGDSVDRHALQAGLQNVLIELRNDLIATDVDQTQWAARLAPLLTEALKEAKNGAGH